MKTRVRNVSTVKSYGEHLTGVKCVQVAAKIIAFESNTPKKRDSTKTPRITKE